MTSSKKQDFKYVRIKLDIELHKRFKALCVLNETDMTEQVVKMIEDYIEKYDQSND